MPLTIGSRLGRYEILSAIGEGGMGQVYRARDTRLGRTVAIKILNTSLAMDPSFGKRFENEARTLSRIAHPNICVLHDVDLGDPSYLVLEYLEGEALDQRIERGPLLFEDVRRIGAEICRALDTAHKAGIVHRDLKPANVMLTRTGAKLLDFGIAVEQRGHTAANLTTAVALTLPGSVIGTPAYIAPEQLQGIAADARSDIFALGAVLYEAATGRRAFPGDTPAAIGAAILSSDPPAPSTRRPELPAGFDALVAGCLARNPDERWQSAHDVGRQLDALTPRTGTQARAAPGRSWVLAGTIAAVAVAASSAAAAWTWRAPAPLAGAPTVAFKIVLPSGTTMTDTVEGNAIALSPDGLQLAWVGEDANTTTRIWIRSLAQLEARPVPGTEGATSLFWSPDSHSIAFFAKGSLQRLDVQGSGALVICPVTRGQGYTGTWGADGRILFAPIQGQTIYSVSTGGGIPQPAFAINAAAGERRVGWPWFLPDGRSVLYLVFDTADTRRLMLARPNQPPQRVTDIPTEAQFVDAGYLVFGRSGSLLARRFDPVSGQMSGDPVQLASGVEMFPPTGWGGFTASRSGSIAFLSGAADAHLAWIDPDGRVTGYLGVPGNYLDVALGSGNDSVLATRMDNGTGVYDIWSVDIARGTETRVTSGPSTNITALMSPLGTSMFFARTAGGAPELMRRDIPTGAETQLVPGNRFQEPLAITRDGATLVFLQRGERGDWDIFTVPTQPGRPSSPLLATTFNEVDGRLSPDDGAIAFTSDETGHNEIYVAPFPRASPKLRLSAGGGRLPRWTGAHTLMFLADDGHVMRVEVTSDPSLHASTLATAFAQPLKLPWRDFLALPGGRLLAIVPDAVAQNPLTVVTTAVR
jgi:Tol biopolymer transport system component